MRIDLAIQPSSHAYTWLANWLATVNADQLARDGSRLGASGRSLRDSSAFLWSWQDVSALPPEIVSVSPFSRAALMAGEIRARGWRALAGLHWPHVRSVLADRDTTVPAKISLVRRAPHAIDLVIAYRQGRLPPHKRVIATVPELKSPIHFYFKWDEDRALSLANWLARWNATLLRLTPGLPHLYDTNVEYARETIETWSDYTSVLAQGWEDCDSLAAAYAGLLLARGWRALRPGDPGYTMARAQNLKTIPAEVIFHTYTRRNEPGLTHVLVRYHVGGKTYFEDPSARLGMYGGKRLGASETQARLATIRRELEAA